MYVRVTVVGDDPWARAGLAAILTEADLAVIAQLETNQASQIVDSDVVVWDSPQQWEELYVPVVVLIHHPEAARGWLERGAKGLLLRKAETSALAHAVMAVAHGLVVVEPDLLDLEPIALEDQRPLAEALTPRELEVLRQLALGQSNKAIARGLDLSEHTVKFHVASILSKFGVESRTEAVIRAVQLGLVML